MLPEAELELKSKMATLQKLYKQAYN